MTDIRYNKEKMEFEVYVVIPGFKDSEKWVPLVEGDSYKGIIRKRDIISVPEVLLLTGGNQAQRRSELPALKPPNQQDAGEVANTGIDREFKPKKQKRKAKPLVHEKEYVVVHTPIIDHFIVSSQLVGRYIYIKETDNPYIKRWHLIYLTVFDLKTRKVTDEYFKVMNHQSSNVLRTALSVSEANRLHNIDANEIIICKLTNWAKKVEYSGNFIIRKEGMVIKELIHQLYHDKELENIINNNWIKIQANELLNSQNKSLDEIRREDKKLFDESK